MEILVSLLPWVLIFGVFWFFLIRPQKKQQKQHQQMLQDLQVGDKVVTAGGIKGKIIKIRDESVRLRISTDVDIDLMKNSISRLEEEEAEDKAGEIEGE
ncbi:preprotein translocase subunit YajC [Halarsenatibacter silvermanii]|uniref:Preprotein translocase subunit YajC n=1 Tax=Halarsenatibacter silvermanii TaxID=321763 RepID=A0A1G9JT45_9FIRM|nr:preprotein translocase subunit YajC [Halarsenatibacter silvermanii]SDL40304.1 preprotein translocase subunit YajC [Halarsenatibacter silvermanii]